MSAPPVSDEDVLRAAAADYAAGVMTFAQFDELRKELTRPNAVITVRIRRDLHEQLKIDAAAARRSLNQHCIYLLSGGCDGETNVPGGGVPPLDPGGSSDVPAALAEGASENEV